MSARTYFPPDARMHREEEWTLSRISSNQDSQATADRSSSGSGAASHSLADNSNSQAGSALLHRRFVFTDPVAFRYLEDDVATVVLERRGRLKGYQLYLVEQWACSRVHPTFVITTFTGDPSHSVLVGVLGVPADENMWSPRLRVYFKAISQFHARPKETPLGMLMVTNLSGFPSALTVIPVPDGDIKRHREDFIVNENLKRLGCSGRSGLSLAQPAGATMAKFHQLYKTSDRIDLYSAVIELVKLCQVSLMMFGKLEQEYADGLLCDVTERAINDWWTEFGSEYYNIEPADGILGPTTVSALLGMLMGARNRLNYFGAPVAKDVFDITSLKRGIAYFQKSQKLDRTRRLDRQTLACLRRVTAKAAAGEGWAVPKAVKSTVAELSGKGGEMVMGMVGARDKAGIGDIETLDIDRFVTLVHGDRSKWLWYGKHKRSGTGDSFGKSLPESGSMVFSKDDSGGYVWSNKKSESIPAEDEDELRKKESGNNAYSTRPSGPPGAAVSVGETPTDRDPQLRKTVFKSVTGKMSDARSGFGRIKDAVGLRGHTSRHSKDEAMEGDGSMNGYLSPDTANIETIPGFSPMPGNLGKAFTWKNKPEEYQDGYRKDRDSATITTPTARLRDSESPPSDFKISLPLPSDSAQGEMRGKDLQEKAIPPAQPKELQGDMVTAEPSANGSAFGDRDVGGLSLDKRLSRENSHGLLKKRRSIGTPSTTGSRIRNDAWWPRHLSFSDVEEAVLEWQDIGDAGSSDGTDSGKNNRRDLAEEEKRLFNRVTELRNYLSEWVETKVAGVEALEAQAIEDQKELQKLYYQLSEIYQNIQDSSQDLLTEERSHLTEVTKEIEGLGAKLEYQINALASKVADVEDGVTQFENQVDNLESHATELEQLLQTEGWLHWAVRTLTGVGLGPHSPGG